MRRITCLAILLIFCSLIIEGCSEDNIQAVGMNVSDRIVESTIPADASVGEKDELQSKMPDSNNKQYLNPDEIEWMTMQGGLGIISKVLFSGHDDVMINKIVNMINSGTDKHEATKTEIDVINSRARPIGICIQLKNMNKVYIWPDYKTKTFKNGWSASPVSDKFILNIKNNGSDEYYAIESKNTADYLREGWKADMPLVKEVTIKSEDGKEFGKAVFRDKDKIFVSGDGCTAKKVLIHISRSNNSEEDYIVGKVVPKFGQWEWDETITKHLFAEGKEFDLSNDLYNIIVDIEGSRIEFPEVIDLRERCVILQRHFFRFCKLSSEK